jgi:hypothetical protein
MRRHEISSGGGGGSYAINGELYLKLYNPNVVRDQCTLRGRLGKTHDQLRRIAGSVGAVRVL